MTAQKNKTIFKVCTGPSCTKNFSQYIWERAVSTAKKIIGSQIETCGCQGRCEKGPTVVVQKADQKKIYANMSPVKMAELMKKTT
jgi:NADH:ubiquinone oxidoreductase subunit E